MSFKGVYQFNDMSSLFILLMRKLGPTKIKELVADFGTRTQNLAPEHKALNFQSSILPSCPVALPLITRLHMELSVDSRQDWVPLLRSIEA